MTPITSFFPRTSKARLSRLIVALSLPVAFSGAFACSFIVNTDDNQCSVSADCAGFGADQVCSNGVCIKPTVSVPDSGGQGYDSGTEDAPSSTGCATASDCPADNVCRASACVALKSTECTTVLGGPVNDSALIFGAVLPTTLHAPPDYLSTLAASATSMTDALGLATTDFESANGLPAAPGTSGSRPLVFVACADDHSASSASAAAKHLISDLAVPAIVGSDFSTFTWAIASELQTLGSNALLITPRSIGAATASGDGGVDDAGLDASAETQGVWRLALTDTAQGAAIAALVADRASTVLAGADGGSPASPNVALISKGDAYGIAVTAAVKASLSSQLSANLTSYGYGNSDDPAYTPQLTESVAGVVSQPQPPNIIIVVGTDEAASNIIPNIEASWPTSGAGSPARPYYFLSDGLLVPGLWSWLESGDPTSARKRILGIAGANAQTAFPAFKTSFESQFTGTGAITAGAAGYYDGAYLLAYSAVAIGSQPVTGPNLALGFQQLAGGGAGVNVGLASLTTTVSSLQEGKTINLQGVSGPLTLSTSTQQVTGTVPQVWCIPAASGVASEAIFSGQTVLGTQVTGTFSPSCN